MADLDPFRVRITAHQRSRPFSQGDRSRTATSISVAYRQAARLRRSRSYHIAQPAGRGHTPVRVTIYHCAKKPFTTDL